MNDRIRIRASLAVLLIDDFTGKIITAPGLTASVDGDRKPIRKPEGFLVFTNLTDPTIRVTVEGPCYFREEQYVDMKSLDRSNPVFRIRMRPDRTYPLPENTVRLTALLPPESTCFVFYEKGNDSRKLLTDYEKGNANILLYQGDKEEMEGKTCCITGKNGGYEFLRLGRLTEREKGSYLLEKPLEQGYKKIGSRLYPVSVMRADGGKECFLPLKNHGQNEPEYTLILKKDGAVKEIRKRLVAGRDNRLDLRDI